jgi:hypothetical protein
VLFEPGYIRRAVARFQQPARIDPFFDIEAEVRAGAGRDFRVTVLLGNRPAAYDLNSDPPLAEVTSCRCCSRWSLDDPERRCGRRRPPRS